MGIHAEVLLYLMKLTKKDSFEKLSAIFALKDHQTASNIFLRHVIHFFKHNNNIKNIIGIDGEVNQSQIDDMLSEAFARTAPLYKTLVRDFQVRLLSISSYL